MHLLGVVLWGRSIWGTGVEITWVLRRIHIVGWRGHWMRIGPLLQLFALVRRHRRHVSLLIHFDLMAVYIHWVGVVDQCYSLLVYYNKSASVGQGTVLCLASSNDE